MTAAGNDFGRRAPDHRQRDDLPAAVPAAHRVAAPSPLARLAGDLGNRNFGAVVARMGTGEGILAGGAVHPAVQSAIASLAGRGRPLDPALAARLEPSHGDLSDARVHTGPEADLLARSVSATAFTVGRDVFFRRDAYQPATPAGLELAAHELAHVVQQRDQPSTGPLTVSEPGDALEREADDFARHATT